MSENSWSAFCGPTAPSDVLLWLKVLDVRCSHYSALFFLAWAVHQSGTTGPQLQTSVHHSIDQPLVQASLQCLQHPKKAFLCSAWSASVRCGCSYTLQDSLLNSGDYTGPNHDLTMLRWRDAEGGLTIKWVFTSDFKWFLNQSSIYFWCALRFLSDYQIIFLHHPKSSNYNICQVI